MTRQQAEANLKAMGIAEPTKEQIDSYLNTVNGEVQKEKDRADRLKAEADKVSELQEKLDALNNQNLSEIEIAQNETKQANKQVADLQAKIEAMETRAKLAELGLKGDALEKFFDANGKVDFAVLGQILSDYKATGASEKEAEIAGKATNPNGGKVGGTDNEKTEAEKTAEVIGKAMGASTKATTDILSHYIPQ